MGRLTAPEEFAAAILEVVPDARVRVDTPANTNVSLADMGHASDLSLAREVLDWAPRFTMAEAVRDMADWLRQRHA